MQITVKADRRGSVSEIRGRDPDVPAAQLWDWTCEYDPQVRAAVGLHIDYDALLGCGRLARIRMHRHGREVRIDWAAARRYADASPGGLTSKLAVLDPAVAFSEIRYRLSIMGQASARLFTAVARAVGADR